MQSGWTEVVVEGFVRRFGGLVRKPLQNEANVNYFEFDGINDTWIIRRLNRYNDCSVEIFNRYGRSLFKSTGYAKPWSGEWNGQKVPFGTYYYIVEIPKLQKRLSGWVLVVRQGFMQRFGGLVQKLLLVLSHLIILNKIKSIDINGS